MPFSLNDLLANSHRERLSAKYGIEFMPADRVYEIFEEVVNPQALGFVQIRRGIYAKPVSEHIFHLIQLQALKGKNYGIRWGVSLTYIPHGLPGKSRYHRTLKSSAFDLFEDPMDYPLIRNNYRLAEPIPALYGDICFRTELESTWHGLHPIVEKWFNSALSLMGVAEKAHEQVYRRWIGPSHYPNPSFVYALTLIQLGRVDQARIVLQELSEQSDIEPPLYNLEQLLSAITPDNLHQEVSTGDPIGKEIF